MGSSFFDDAFDPSIDVHGSFLISVVAELTGLHPQTLRQYDRLGLVSPGRATGRGRRYSATDIATLRRVIALTSEGVNLEGVRRILDLEHQVGQLRAQVQQLGGDPDAAAAPDATADDWEEPPYLPVPYSLPGTAVVVWHRRPPGF